MSYSLSKSETKAMNCPFYWSAYFGRRVHRSGASWTQTGQEFHDYREHYVNHLVDELLPMDEPWAWSYLAKSGYSDDCRSLIESDIPNFSINPDIVFGTELFWAIDAEFRPVKVDYPGPGLPPVPADESQIIIAHGSLDRVDVDGSHCDIIDYKSGFMPSRIDPYEATHYGLLALLHLPQVETVRFVWDFVRSGSTREQLMERSQIHEYERQLVARIAKREKLLAALERGERMDTDPLAGLCGYCSLVCPVREAAVRGEAIIGPVQTDQDLVEAAGFLQAMKAATSAVDKQIKEYLADRGPVDIGHGKQARLETTQSQTYPLRTVLATLGVQVPVESEQYAIPMDKVMVGATELKRYGKAKSRAGLLEILEATCPRKDRTALKIGDAEE
jgi:hypothetical protein